MSKPATLWLVASFADRDTHAGSYDPSADLARALCGAVFTPLPVGLPARRGPLPGYPLAPEQICPRCQELSGA